VVIILIYRLLQLKSQANKGLEKLVKIRTAELQQAKEEAEKSDHLKTSFLSNMSHEVRTPLNAIIGYSYLLENNDEDSKEVKKYIKEISNSGDNLLKLFENITYLTQLENNDVLIKISSCSIDKIFDTLLLKYNTLITKNSLDIRFTCNFDKTGPLEIITDKNILMRIFEILIENSIKFTEHGEISFGIKSTSPQFKFFVQDTGFGINPDDISSVFDKFRKFNYTTSRLFEGAGIGLTIAKKNVELLRGEITIQSELGKGTLVEFTIPKA
jgi:signal transduction histidine kinase